MIELLQGALPLQGKMPARCGLKAVHQLQQFPGKVIECELTIIQRTRVAPGIDWAIKAGAHAACRIEAASNSGHADGIQAICILQDAAFERCRCDPGRVAVAFYGTCDRLDARLSPSQDLEQLSRLVGSQPGCGISKGRVLWNLNAIMQQDRGRQQFQVPTFFSMDCPGITPYPFKVRDVMGSIACRLEWR